MSEVANKLICLYLNRNWQPTGQITAKDAIVKLCGSQYHPEPTAEAINVEYQMNDDGTPDFNNVINTTPLSWSEWVKLPIRSWDFVINTPHSIIRVPTLLVALNYSKMPVRLFHGRPSKDSIWMRDRGVCQYSGKSLKKGQGDIDHVIPKSKGGGESWDNLVLCSKEVNTKKGNKSNEEVGLKLIKQPTSPRPLYAFELIKEAKHPDWNNFLIK